MASVMVMQGRQIGERVIAWVRGLLGPHPPVARDPVTRTVPVFLPSR